jgi:hypothetical protein
LEKAAFDNVSVNLTRAWMKAKDLGAAARKPWRQ